MSDGQHEAIIDPKVWQKVQEMLQANNARERDQPNAAVSSPLAGIIFDEQGERLTPSHAVKGGRRYRYYISNVLVREPGNTSGIRMSAPEIETAVCQIIHGVLRDPQQVVLIIAAPDPSPSEIEACVGRAKRSSTASPGSQLTSSWSASNPRWPGSALALSRLHCR